MNKLLSLVIGGSLLALSATGFSATQTVMDSNWTCTTNASSATLEADKAADKQMSDKATSASAAYAFAAQNCRDCTKITCQVSE